MRYDLRPFCSAPINVDPLPPNRSRTFSPGREEYCIARTANSTGFSVLWLMPTAVWNVWLPSLVRFQTSPAYGTRSTLFT